jgi:hypothetical protein
MYIDYWIRTTDQEEWTAQAKAAGLLVDSIDLDGKSILIPAQGINIDVIGTIWLPGEYIYEPDGSVIVVKEPVALPGFHVNIRSENEINTDNLSVIAQPKNPDRVWF